MEQSFSVSKRYLFNDSDMRAELEGHEARTRREIDAIDPDDFLNTSPDDLGEHFIGEFTVDVPVLDEGAISIDQSEVRVDVRGDYRRAIWD